MIMNWQLAGTKIAKLINYFENFYSLYEGKYHKSLSKSSRMLLFGNWQIITGMSVQRRHCLMALLSLLDFLVLFPAPAEHDSST